MKQIILVFLFIFLNGFSIAQDKNPFDIVRNQDSILTENVDTLGNTNSDFSEATKIEGVNPFDVSHIPIRKNQYEEIEKLTFKKDESNKETIAISYMPLWIIILSLCILAFIVYLRKDHFVILIKSLVNDNFMRLTNYENNGGVSLIYLLGYALFLINISLFVYLILSRIFNVHWTFQFLSILGSLTLFFAGKHVINGIFARIFFVQKENDIYNFTIISIYNILAAIMVSINILIVFGPSIWLKSLIVTGLFVFTIFLMARYYKGLKIGRNYVSHHFVHFFLYFCAFEFSPWVIIYKLVKDLFL